MIAKDVAMQLAGLQCPVELPKALIAQARQAGLVIAYGASDDLMEFRGAINDELECYNGRTVFVDAMGLLQDFDSIDRHDKEALRDYFKRENTVVAINVMYGDKGGCSWAYQTEIAHEAFDVMADGKVYCRGIVFALTDITSVLAKTDSPPANPAQSL